MSHINPKGHAWTYIPELGQEWEFCDRCNKARRNGSPKLYPIDKALKIAQESGDADVKLAPEQVEKGYWNL